MRKLLLFLPFTAACASSIDGNWVLSEVDQDALEESVLDGLEDDPTFGGLIDLDMSMQMSVGEDLTGTCDLEYLIRWTRVNDGSSYTVKQTIDTAGDINVEENDGSFTIKGEFEGTVRTEMAELDLDDTTDTDPSELIIDKCTLDGDKLTCTEIGESDILLTFSR